MSLSLRRIRKMCRFLSENLDILIFYISAGIVVKDTRTSFLRVFRTKYISVNLIVLLIPTRKINVPILHRVINIILITCIIAREDAKVTKILKDRVTWCTSNVISRTMNVKERKIIYVKYAKKGSASFTWIINTSNILVNAKFAIDPWILEIDVLITVTEEPFIMEEGSYTMGVERLH